MITPNAQYTVTIFDDRIAAIITLEELPAYERETALACAADVALCETLAQMDPEESPQPKCVTRTSPRWRCATP